MVLPRYYASLIDPSLPNCPIRLQAIPCVEEGAPAQGNESFDPLHDVDHKPAPHITHRLQGRALLHLTPNCSMYCRFCFRKSLLNEHVSELFLGSLDASLAYLHREKSLREVILSGGDPLMLSDRALGWAISQLGLMPHIKIIRLHSRTPVTLPSRVTPQLIEALASSKQRVLVTHFNHPREITWQACNAMHLLRGAGITLLNQTVLLAKVNASVATLRGLSEKLFEAGILPYYLHHPDPALGTQMFWVSVEEGRALYHELRKQMPGYLVPRYVQDHPSRPYKDLPELFDRSDPRPKSI